ncbi:Asp-tRNA(Asn)/Glu-tRNA(Gln) amidotransferase subunit GatA [Candidatus Woesearchaeota archaeon]|jgi:aspartyl-tRNA(Asn)/glutamyl-tRNA(Gln) amidotransferase subunit A|nr:Asp-tRNA(Asn)/Glu-tRNA(Gln) amidotransferase subunit GatA [Candidatus Woesearchaeota archaeon]
MKVEEKVRDYFRVIKEKNKELNVFLYVDEKNGLKRAKELDLKKGQKGKLFGMCFAVKANINVIGMPISCSSKTLENYKGTYDADVIRKIKDDDGIILGIVNCDEFACGSGQNSGFGRVLNPVVLDRVAGGSSSGSAAAVAAGMCDVALGSDTGGSVRNPASHCGIVGVKPSYGRVSRYGLVDLSMSLDQIGVLGRDVEGVAKVMEVISGRSENDPSTFDRNVENYGSFSDLKKLKIGLSEEFKKLCVDKRIWNLILEKIKEKGFVSKGVNLKYTKLGVQTYYPIVYTEFYSGTRKFDGRKYGKKIEENCGEEVLRRILGGAEISKAEHSGKYYRKALAVKGLIKKDFDDAFKKVDVIVSPVTPSLPPRWDEELSAKEIYALDAFTIPANLAGICAGVVPLGELDGVPVGMQVMCPAFQEKKLFDVMKVFE